jgi:hypothetical protein
MYSVKVSNQVMPTLGCDPIASGHGYTVQPGQPIAIYARAQNFLYIVVDGVVVVDLDQRQATGG